MLQPFPVASKNVIVKGTVFWDLAPFSSVEVYWPHSYHHKNLKSNKNEIVFVIVNNKKNKKQCDLC
jgi:hypothetical protein